MSTKHLPTKTTDMYLLEHNVKVLQKMLVPQEILNAHSVDQHHPEDPWPKGKGKTNWDLPTLWTPKTPFDRA